jgi:hypothetical protein
LPEGATVPVPASMNIKDYLEFVNVDKEVFDALPDGSAILFATAADDALEVIELVHTQVVTDDFLNGFTDFVIEQPQP